MNVFYNEKTPKLFNIRFEVSHARQAKTPIKIQLLNGGKRVFLKGSGQAKKICDIYMMTITTSTNSIQFKFLVQELYVELLATIFLL